MTRLLFFARDPGPANQVVAAHEVLAGLAGAPMSEGMRAFVSECQPFADCLVAARGPAIEVWRRAGYEPRCFDDLVAPARASAVEGDRIDAVLDALHIGAVVTGTTDIDDDTDRLLWRAAERRGLPSHAFLDFPGELTVRFRCADGQRAHPQYVYAPDESYMAGLVAAGVEVARIRICGPIHQQRLARLSALSGDAYQRPLRDAWGAEADDRVVLFASQCLSEMAEAGRPSRHDELAVLDDLTRRLEDGESLDGLAPSARDIILVVRPHPRDRAGKYEAWQGAQGARLRRVVSSDGGPEEAILAADLVAGINSSLLRDAKALGRPAVSLTGDAIDMRS